MKEKKLISWNVNGIRACVGKGFYDAFASLDADIFCLQETKLQPGQLDLETPGYYQYWSYAEKKGYSGTAVFTKEEPLGVTMGVGVPSLDGEGRMITLEFPDYYFITVYVPNSQDGLKRIDHRCAWEDAFRQKVTELQKSKPVIFCGDLNVAKEPIDLKNPKANEGRAGYSQQERVKFRELLGAGFIDTFRYFNPELEGAYSWWSYKFGARERNAGWRIDYFCVSDDFKSRLVSASIHSEIYGSDHCPVELVIK